MLWWNQLRAMSIDGYAEESDVKDYFHQFNRFFLDTYFNRTYISTFRFIHNHSNKLISHKYQRRNNVSEDFTTW